VTRSPAASVTVGASTVVVRARGEFDFARTEKLRSVLADASNAGLPIVVDLTAVTFMDAACLGEIARASARLRDAGRDLHVVGAQGVVRRIFELTDLASLLSS
jgi:anti-sigma B factor antagonist